MKVTPKMQELVDAVIKDMESGKSLPWEKPWFINGVKNWKTERGYNGINCISLNYAMESAGLQHGQFLTFKQAQECGGKIKKGSHGFPVWFFKPLVRKDENGDEDTIPLMMTYIVFGIDQVEGLNPKPVRSRELSLNAIGEMIIQKSGATIQETGSDRAYYSLKEDFINVPSRSSWKNDEAFYSTVFHELTHWTAHKSRLNRDLSKYSTNIQERAFEELVAELGGAFLAAHCGFQYDTQHSAYLKGWVSLLKDHKDALYLAASKAQKAANFILAKAGLIEVKEEKAA